MPIVRAAITQFTILFIYCQSPSFAADDDPPSLTGTAAKSSVLAVGGARFTDAPSADQELRSLFTQYKDALSTEMWDEADTLAKTIVDVSIRTNGRDSKVTAVALTNLGTLQRANEDPVAAVQNLSAAIDIIERLDNRLSSDLILPLREMGRAELNAGFPDRASAAWSRAVHVSHVNFGPHNMEQVEPLAELARMYFNAGMSKEAIKVRRRIYYLQARDAEAWKKDRSPAL
jgi:tetratricopeptide (TPR) repeat protein